VGVENGNAHSKTVEVCNDNATMKPGQQVQGGCVAAWPGVEGSRQPYVIAGAHVCSFELEATGSTLIGFEAQFQLGCRVIVLQWVCIANHLLSLGHAMSTAEFFLCATKLFLCTIHKEN
jgi:hypothetical protein